MNREQAEIKLKKYLLEDGEEYFEIYPYFGFTNEKAHFFNVVFLEPSPPGNQLYQVDDLGVFPIPE